MTSVTCIQQHPLWGLVDNGLEFVPDKGEEDATGLDKDARRGVEGAMKGPPRLCLELEVHRIHGHSEEVREEHSWPRVHAATDESNETQVDTQSDTEWTNHGTCVLRLITFKTFSRLILQKC